MRKIFIVILLIPYTLCFSQNQLWINSINSTNANSYAKFLTTDKNNNVIVGGNGFVYTMKGNFVMGRIVKYNSSGLTLWSLSPGLATTCNYVSTDSLGNVYYTGSTGRKIISGRINSSGSGGWGADYDMLGFNAEHTPNSILADKNLNSYMVCSVIYHSSFYTINSICLVKYNFPGTQLWQKILFKSYGNVTVNEMALDDSDFAYIASNYGQSASISKVSSSGDSIWTVSSTGTGISNADAKSIKVDKSKNIYVTGYCTVAGMGTNILTSKYSHSGSLIWQRTFSEQSGNINDVGNKLVIDDSLNCIVTGKCGNKLVTLKYDSAGVLRSSSYFFDGAGINEGISIKTDNLCNVYVSGVSNGDYITIKYSPSLIQLWAARYNGSGIASDTPVELGLDNSGGLYVTGTSQESNGYSAITTLKYSVITEIKVNSEIISNNYSLSQNYPNPFNPSTVISYQLPVVSNVTLIVYDVLGNEVQTLVSEKQNPGGHSIDFNAASLPSGIYFYKLVTEKFSETKKMVLIK